MDILDMLDKVLKEHEKKEQKKIYACGIDFKKKRRNYTVIMERYTGSINTYNNDAAFNGFFNKPRTKTIDWIEEYKEQERQHLKRLRQSQEKLKQMRLNKKVVVVVRKRQRPTSHTITLADLLD